MLLFSGCPVSFQFCFIVFHFYFHLQNMSHFVVFKQRNLACLSCSLGEVDPQTTMRDRVTDCKAMRCSHSTAVAIEKSNLPSHQSGANVFGVHMMLLLATFITTEHWVIDDVYFHVTVKHFRLNSKPQRCLSTTRLFV